MFGIFFFNSVYEAPNICNVDTSSCQIAALPASHGFKWFHLEVNLEKIKVQYFAVKLDVRAVPLDNTANLCFVYVLIFL